MMTRLGRRYECVVGIVLAVVIGLLAAVSATYFEALDDSILHKIQWLGPMPEDALVCCLNISMMFLLSV